MRELARTPLGGGGQALSATAHGTYKVGVEQHLEAVRDEEGLLALRRSTPLVAEPVRMANRHRCAIIGGMATTMQHCRKRARSMRDAMVELFWFWAFAALLLTLAIVVVGGTRFLTSSTVQVVIGALLVLASLHLWNQHRHSDERKHDPRLRRDRERRGY